MIPEMRGDEFVAGSVFEDGPTVPCVRRPTLR